MESNAVLAVITLLQNVSLGVAVVLAYSGAGTWTDRVAEPVRRALIGLIFGVTTILAMLIRVQLAPGIIVSSYAASMGLAGLFGGWIGGLVAAVIGIGSRIAIGGAGTLGGSLSAGLAAAVGIAMSELVRRTTGTIRVPHLLLQSALIVLTSWSTYFLLPPDVAWPMLQRAAVPLAVVLPTATIFFGWLMLLDARRRDLALRLRESERRFTAMVSNVPGCVYQVRRSPDGSVVSYPFLSEGFEAIYGIPAAAAQANPRLILDAYLPEDEDERIQSLHESMERLNVRSRDTRIRLADGSIRWVRSASVPRRIANGDTMWDGIMIDITRQKALEQELKRADRLSAVGQLTEGVAHEFNNLLTIISGYAQLQLRKHGSETDDGAVAMQVLQATDRGTRITRALLAFTRRQPLQAATADLNALLRQSRELTESVLGPTIRFVLHTDPELWPVVVDGTQFEIAVMSLVHNARDALPNGGTVEIRTANRALNMQQAATVGLPVGKYVSVTIEDTGVGMTSEVLEQAMDPFFTTKPTGAGPGLGLSLVHGFAKQSGGALLLDSRPVLGTRAQLLLPAKSA